MKREAAWAGLVCPGRTSSFTLYFLGQIVILKLLLGPVAGIGASETPPRLQSAGGRRAAAAPYLWRLHISSADLRPTGKHALRATTLHPTLRYVRT
jgi:hypothetical protein